MKYAFVLVIICYYQTSMAQMDYEKLAQDFLYNVRVEKDYETIAKQLAEVGQDELQLSLDSENRKKAFWLNIYNAYIQIKAKENSAMIVEHKNQFFTKSWIKIANQELSFDDIEHGILRHSKWKYGMGYLPSIFVGSFEKSMRINEVDYRIHFALNCGAKGCPPIAYYTADNLDHQLDLATAGFIELNSSYDPKTNTVEVSKILSWFKGDFGGKEGILKLLSEHSVIPEQSKAKINFTEYDWTLSLSNYIDN